MKNALKRAIKKVVPFAFLEPEGETGIQKIGHRAYVGGLWDEIGNLQFEFLVAKGLRPEHFLLDIACGSLRLGVKAIPYLDRGHYLGIDKEGKLLQAGLEQELGAAMRESKAPRTAVSDSFEFEKLGQTADFAIAQSLFSHLPPPIIDSCFNRLWPCLTGPGAFYATYFESVSRVHNPETPHDHGYFAYTREEMCSFGERNGFDAHYIGDWKHPREQVMVEYRKRR